MSLANQSLLAIEAELQRQYAEPSGPVIEVCRYATAGGRRTRALLLLSAVQDAEPRAIVAATALEMIHAATLLQDDIFDGGDLRRGRPAAHLRFGKAMTILASDWLLIRALELAAEVDSHFFRCLARAGTAMTQAEARELTPSPLHSLQEAQSHGATIARGKTAVLFGTALCGAAVFEGVSPQERTRWEQIGVEIGLTYQVVDDCVDLYGAEAAAGKTLGHDLIAGCLTLPVLLAAHALEQAGTPVPLQDLHAGRLQNKELMRLRDVVHSDQVKEQVFDHLQRRFAAHRTHAAEARLSMHAVQSLQIDLQARLNPCFATEISPADQSPSFAPAGVSALTACQPHA